MSVGIAIFAKAPIEGFAKTRLVPRLGPRLAADLQRRMIERTTDTALASGVGPVSIFCAPDRGHALFQDLAARHGVDLHVQRGPDLGARMLRAFEQLTPNGPLLLVGTDCPVLHPCHLRACAEVLLDGRDAVFLPTEDGGYALVGLRRPVPALFAAMPWSTEAVMPETRARVRQLGLTSSEPAILWDVDTPADYERASSLGLFDVADSETSPDG